RWSSASRAVVQSLYSFGFKPLDPCSDRSGVTLEDVSDLLHRVPFARQQDHPDPLRDPAYFTASQTLQFLTLPLVDRSDEHHGACSSRWTVAYPLIWKSATYLCNLT